VSEHQDPGTEVDNRTRSRLRGAVQNVDNVRRNGGTPEEICAALEKLLTFEAAFGATRYVVARPAPIGL